LRTRSVRRLDMDSRAGFDELLKLIKRAREKVARGNPMSESLLLCTQQLESLYDINIPAAKREVELEFMKTLLGGKSLSEVTQRLREVVRLLERHGLPNSVCQSRVLDAYEAAARRRTSTKPAPTLREVREEFQRTNHVALLPNEWVMFINMIIGRRPQAAFGNSTGDQQMLEYAGAGNGVRLMRLVHHDDAGREYAYGAESKIGTFSDALIAEAKKKGWIRPSKGQRDN